VCVLLLYGPCFLIQDKQMNEHGSRDGFSARLTTLNPATARDLFICQSVALVIYVQDIKIHFTPYTRTTFPVLEAKFRSRESEIHP